MKLNANEPTHHSYSNATQKRFDADVKKLIQTFDGRFIDPFDLRDPTIHITNFATGVVTSGAVGESLLGALEKGKMKLDGQEKPQKSFYNPLPKANVKTMTNMQKTVKVMSKTVGMNG